MSTSLSQKAAVLRFIAQREFTLKTDLLQQFAIHSSALTRMLEEFVQAGFIEEGGRGQSTGGRKPILYQIKSRRLFLLGLDISRTYSILGLFDLKLTPLDFCTWTMDKQMTPELLIHLMKQQVHQWKEQFSIDSTSLLGLGVGAVGPVDREKGIIIDPQHFHAPGWQHISLREHMAEALQLPVLLENGSNTALLGEHWHDSQQPVNHMLYVHAGVGIRFAVMTDGKLVHGAADNEAAIGQMIIQADGSRLHGQSKTGVLEDYASIQALEQRIHMLYATGQADFAFASDPAAVHFQMMMEQLKAGNTSLKQLFGAAGSYLGIGLANAINLLYPEKVIIGGPLSHYSDDYFEAAAASATANLYGPANYRPLFSKGKLQEKGVAAGAASMLYSLLLL